MRVFSKKQLIAAATAVLVTVAGLVSAAVIAWTKDPQVIQAANKTVTCQSVNQLLQKYAKDSGSSFDALKCESITAIDLTHWVAIVDITLAGTTKQWSISVSTNGVSIDAAAPLPSN